MFHDITNLHSRWHKFLKTKYREPEAWSEGYQDNPLVRGEPPGFLYPFCTRIRAWVEDFEIQSGALMALLCPLVGPNITEGLFYPQTKKGISIAQQARRLEAAIRDHLQLQGSKLALEESKKSIELSNNQIYESKRVKIFTVLALFFVPLNLATSVFGMNLQQLNHSGTSIEVFLGTAGILLFVTGVSWLFLEGLQNARVLLRRLIEDKSSVASGDPSIFVRLFLIWWLSRNGLFKWMIYTGAGWCLLINSSRGFQPGEGNLLENFRAIELVLHIMPDVAFWRDQLDYHRGGWLPKLFRRRARRRTPSPLGSSNG